MLVGRLRDRCRSVDRGLFWVGITTLVACFLLLGIATRHVTDPRTGMDLNDRGSVLLETSMGEIEVELYWEHAPRTCANFHTLSSRGYYDGTVFHRIIKGFMIQGGDPEGTGKGGASIYGPKFDDEFSPQLKHTGAGILSMANSGPNTQGSQFFITLAPTPWLDNMRTVFGRVKKGMDVVEKMGLVKTNHDDRPLQDVVLRKAHARQAK